MPSEGTQQTRKRTTDVYGNVTPNGVVELDPWGANTARSSPTVFQPQTFTGITDANGDQDARARRYSPTGRFPQPDPSGGSYDFSNPQSLNRYAYVGNDPINFRDPSGREPNSSFCGTESGWGQCGSSGFWGQGNLIDRPHGHENPTDSLNCPPGHVCFKVPIERDSYRLIDLGWNDKFDPFSKDVLARENKSGSGLRFCD
jgi:RHS repeat-associated protein